MSEAAVVDNVLLQATGAVREAVRLQLLQAARELCYRSGVWIEDVTIPLTGASTYLIPMPTGANVSQIDGVMVDGRTLAPVRTHGRPFKLRGSYYTYHLATGRIEFAEAYPSGNAYLRVWARPELVENIPAHLYEHYDEALEAGTMYRIMMQPDRPYSNPALATVHYRKFVRQCTLAKRQALGGHSRADVGFRFRK